MKAKHIHKEGDKVRFKKGFKHEGEVYYVESTVDFGRHPNVPKLQVIKLRGFNHNVDGARSGIMGEMFEPVDELPEELFTL